MYSAQCIQKAGASLGESPVWDPEGRQLYWVDINNRHINCLDLKSGDTLQWPCHTEIGCIGLAKQGKLIAGLRDGFHYFNPSNGVFDLKTGDTLQWPCHTEIGCIGLAKQGRLIAGLRDGFHYFNPSNGVFDLIVDPEPDKPINRLNDGKVDRAGRMWSGSMRDPNPDQPSGALYRLDSSGNYACILDGIRIPNAIAWSPDNRIMYFGDTRAGIIWAFDFNLTAGEITNKRVFVDLSGQSGRPDGATVDAEGYLWNAEYGGSRVVRYTPDGKYDQQVDLPVTNVTCCAFGGLDFSTLFITTAAQNLTAAELENQPLAGGLFACDLDIRGLPEPYFADKN